MVKKGKSSIERANIDSVGYPRRESYLQCGRMRKNAEDAEAMRKQRREIEYGSHGDVNSWNCPLSSGLA